MTARLLKTTLLEPRLDYRLMMGGPVHVVRGRTVLDTIIRMLRELEYDVVVVDARG